MRWSSCAADEASPPLCGSRPVALLSAGLACFWHLPALLEHVCAFQYCVQSDELQFFSPPFIFPSLVLLLVL